MQDRRQRHKAKTVLKPAWRDQPVKSDEQIDITKLNQNVNPTEFIHLINFHGPRVRALIRDYIARITLKSYELWIIEWAGS